MKRKKIKTKLVKTAVVISALCFTALICDARMTPYDGPGIRDIDESYRETWQAPHIDNDAEETSDEIKTEADKETGRAASVVSGFFSGLFEGLEEVVFSIDETFNGFFSRLGNMILSSAERLGNFLLDITDTEETPGEEDPIEQDPVEEEPSEDPIEDEPLEDPTEDEPVEEEPVEEEPVEEDPIDNEPVDEEPTDDPIEDEPVEETPEEEISFEHLGMNLTVNSDLVGNIDEDDDTLLLYDKDENLFASLSETEKTVYLSGSENTIVFEEGADLEIISDNNGNINYVNLASKEGTYNIEIDSDEKLNLHTPAGDSVSYTLNEFEGCGFIIEEDGAVVFTAQLKDSEAYSIIETDNTGAINFISLPESDKETVGFPIEKEDEINLSITVNPDGSILAQSSVEESTSVVFHREGTLELIFPDRPSASISRDIEKVIFYTNGIASLSFND